MRIVIIEYDLVLLFEIVGLLTQAHRTVQIVFAGVGRCAEIALRVRQIAEHEAVVEAIERILLLLSPCTLHSAIFLSLLAAVDATVRITCCSRRLADEHLPLAVLSPIEFQFFDCRLAALGWLYLDRVSELYSLLIDRRRLLNRSRRLVELDNLLLITNTVD